MPVPIRKILGLGRRDQVVFRGLSDGTVVIAKKQARADEGDPVIGKFLKLLARDHGRSAGADSARTEVAARARQGPRQRRQGRSQLGSPR